MSAEPVSENPAATNAAGESANGKRHHLDTCGLFCPEPVMLLHNIVRDMAEGDTVEVVATDPSTQRDIPKFCTFLGHPLLSQCVEEDRFCYVIQKGPG
jgi:tRNA 2-thiouridine synthesizing protein A